ncbi:Uncharacterised protein [Escherichia coli]|nr:Uncharacterised protein [Escherichia coli]
MRRDFCDIRVNILFKQGTLHPGQRFAFFTETLLACELHLLYMNASRLQGFRSFDIDGRLQLYIRPCCSHEAAGPYVIR